MSRKQAYVYFYASYWGKIIQIYNSDIFSLKIRIPDKKNLFVTLLGHRDTGTLEQRDTWTPGHWNTGTSGHWGTGTLGHCDTGTPGHPYIGISG